MGTLTKPIAYPSQDILRFVFPADHIPTWTVTATSPPDETIDVPEYTNTELANALSQYIADIPVQAAAASAAEVAEGQEIVNLISQSGTGSAAPSLISCSGRHYIRQNRWYTGADDLYGYAYHNFVESAGSGTVPILEWEHLGLYIPAGRRLGNWHVVGRTNSVAVTDIQFYIALCYPDSPTRWTDGYDHDSEMDSTVVLNDMFVNPVVGVPFTGGNMLDMRRRSFDLNHTVAQDCFFNIYMKPTTTSNSLRHFYHTWTLEVF